MDDYVIQQKIQRASHEPRAPESLIQSVILRAQALTMGVQAQKQLETAPAEKVGELASRVLIGQLAAVSALPKGAQPEQLAQQLEQEPKFAEAISGGNVMGRLKSGELIRQITGQKLPQQSDHPEMTLPKKEGPAL